MEFRNSPLSSRVVLKTPTSFTFTKNENEGNNFASTFERTKDNSPREIDRWREDWNDFDGGWEKWRGEEVEDDYTGG